MDPVQKSYNYADYAIDIKKDKLTITAHGQKVDSFKVKSVKTKDIPSLLTKSDKNKVYVEVGQNKDSSKFMYIKTTQKMFRLILGHHGYKTLKSPTQIGAGTLN